MLTYTCILVVDSFLGKWKVWWPFCLRIAELRHSMHWSLPIPRHKPVGQESIIQALRHHKPTRRFQTTTHRPWKMSNILGDWGWLCFVYVCVYLCVCTCMHVRYEQHVWTTGMRTCAFLCYVWCMQNEHIENSALTPHLHVCISPYSFSWKFPKSKHLHAVIICRKKVP